MKYCKFCLLPDTKPQLIFDANGVCCACTNSKVKQKIDWESKQKDFIKLIEKYRNKDGSNYDCIIPVSGGKDSTFQVYTMKEKFGLNPLAVSFHALDKTELGRKNLESLKKIGVDCIEFSPNPIIYNKLAKFGLTELGDFQWPEHIGIFTVPIQIAVKYNIPLIIWGENSQFEYGQGQPTDISKEILVDKEWNEKNGGYFLDKIKPKDMTKHGFELKDLKPYIYPSDEEIKKVGVNAIFLGSYIKWDIFKQLELVKKLGFKEDNEIREGTYDSWENIDVKFTSFHDYFKFLKFGFGRATDHTSIEIRLGRMTREKGLELVKKHEGRIPVKYLDEFLKEAEISYDEFIIICEKFTNKKLFKKDKNGKLLRNQEGNIEKISYDN
jgi:N-acetyl sugar amidotransferase